MSEQIIMTASEEYKELNDYLYENRVERIFLVCDSSIPFLRISKYFDTLEHRMGIEVVRFSDFKPNPLYESIVDGVKLYHQTNCDLIIAVGGGSAMDVAKCIKLYSNMDSNVSYLEQKIVPNEVKLLAVPTTAGTGSEATRFSVIYFNGEKQSVYDDSCIPSTVLMDASVLKTLPIYQKKSTMLDALCHGIESFWSINSTEESKKYSREAIRLIIENINLYLENDDTGSANMLRAANIAGKAINITQTTAGHAMCYKLTSMYGIAHGHAAALCIAKIWPYMLEHIAQCIDTRGENYLHRTFNEIADAMRCRNAKLAVAFYLGLLDRLELTKPMINTEEEYEVLKRSVNPIRLKNHPIRLDEEVIDLLYHQILSRD